MANTTEGAIKDASSETEGISSETEVIAGDVNKTKVRLLMKIKIHLTFFFV